MRMFSKQDTILKLLYILVHFYSLIKFSCIRHYDFKDSSRTKIVSSKKYADEYV
jgi:hypothetical protein